MIFECGADGIETSSPFEYEVTLMSSAGEGSI